jgi:FlaA1/EpsC-like NDP-sugar epimerase
LYHLRGCVRSLRIVICLHLFTSVYICLHLFTFIYICLHLFTFVYICLHLFTFVYICLHLFTSVYICLHLFTFVLHLSTSVYICLHLFTFVYICLHLFTFATKWQRYHPLDEEDRSRDSTTSKKGSGHGNKKAKTTMPTAQKYSSPIFFLKQNKQKSSNFKIFHTRDKRAQWANYRRQADIGFFKIFEKKYVQIFLFFKSELIFFMKLW